MAPSRDLSWLHGLAEPVVGTAEPGVARLKSPTAPVATSAPPLTAFQRVLLSTDGTLTRVLEAYAGEPVEVVKLLQATEVSDARDGDLLLRGVEPVLRRRVLLRGRRSRRHLLYAEAVVLPGRVEPAFLAGLLETDKPIGTLLAETRTETFREILAVGREEAGACAVHFDTAPSAELVVRTYRIWSHGQPIVLITEKFPSTFFRELPE